MTVHVEKDLYAVVLFSSGARPALCSWWTWLKNDVSRGYAGTLACSISPCGLPPGLCMMWLPSCGIWSQSISSLRPDPSQKSCIRNPLTFKLHISHFHVCHCWEKIVVIAETMWPKYSCKAPKSYTDLTLNFLVVDFKTRYLEKNVRLPLIAFHTGAFNRWVQAVVGNCSPLSAFTVNHWKWSL